MGNGAPLRDSTKYATITRERLIFLRAQLAKPVDDFVPADKACARTEGRQLKSVAFESEDHGTRLSP